VKLTRELRRRLAPGAALLHRSGKWYPGESLPRWALDIVGARDGSPLWPDRDMDGRPDLADARRLAQALAWRLRLVDGLHEAFEDPWRVLQDEASVPIEVDPRRADLDDPEERRRLARILSRGVGQEAGWVIPIAPAPDGDDGWLTEKWQ